LHHKRSTLSRIKSDAGAFCSLVIDRESSAQSRTIFLISQLVSALFAPLGKARRNCTAQLLQRLLQRIELMIKPQQIV